MNVQQINHINKRIDVVIKGFPVFAHATHSAAVYEVKILDDGRHRHGFDFESLNKCNTQVGVISWTEGRFFIKGAISVDFPELSKPKIPTFNI